MKIPLQIQGCALAESSGPSHLTFALGRIENPRFFVQIICWPPLTLQVQGTRLPTIFLRVQPCNCYNQQWLIKFGTCLPLLLKMSHFY